MFEVGKIAYKPTLDQFLSDRKVSSLGSLISRLIEVDLVDMLQSLKEYHEFLSDPYKAWNLKQWMWFNGVTRKLNQGPVFHEIEAAASREYANTAEVLDLLNGMDAYNVKYHLIDFPSYRHFISDSGRATELLNAITIDESSFKTFKSNAVEMTRLQIAANRKLWETKYQADLDLLASNPFSYLDVVGSLNGRTFMEHFSTLPGI